jgi:dTDP-4-dehydrorhamnose reductase
MRPEILILGGDGMLGHKIVQRLRSTAPTLSTIRGKSDASEIIGGVDLMDFPAVQKLLGELRPSFLINCAGIVKQRPEASGAIASITINALLPHRLAEWCSSWGGRLIHFSTDCVFSGSRGNYTEEDSSDATDLYGRSKFLGEVHISSGAPNALTLRTSMIGRELKRHTSLLDWFLAQNHRTVRGFRRVIYSGVTTNHLAALVEHIIDRHARLTGLYQVAAAPISKYDLLVALREAYRLDIEIVPDDNEICDRSMKGDKLRQAIGYQAPAWPDLLAQLAQEHLFGGEKTPPRTKGGSKCVLSKENEF